MTSITDIARRLGVSVSTVSRALNGGGAGASAEMRELVQEAARAMNYTPNHSARSLRSGATKVIGFMARSATTGESDNFYARLFDGLQQALIERGLELLVIPTPYGVDPLEFLDRTVSRGVVDGVILSHMTEDDPRLGLLLERDFPFVCLGHGSNPEGYSWVEVDTSGFSTAVATRLAARGRRRVALTLPPDAQMFGSLILDSLRPALSARGIALADKHVVYCEPTERAGYDATMAVLSGADAPDAIVLTNVSHTVGCYRGIHECGLQTGADVSVIGFRTPYSDYLTPSLTSFEHAPHNVGRTLAEAMAGRIDDPRPAIERTRIQTLLPLTLIEGDSA